MLLLLFRCGVIQEGDRVIAINGADVIGYTLDECKQLLDRSKARCELVIAFDVAGMLTRLHNTDLTVIL